MSDEALPPLPTFEPTEKVCGNCKLWRPYSVDARGWVGPCRVQPSRGHFPGTAPICDAFAPKGAVTAAAAVAAPAARPRPLKNIAPTVVRRDRGGESPRSISTISTLTRRDPRADEEIDLGGLENMTREELMDVFREASGDAEAPPMANKWQGGVVQLLPGNREMQGKEMPIDSLFHKVVMIRDRLRTLEQKINGNTKLTDAEKVEMQHYITRVYGSLTSFNVLFRDREDQFIGQKGDD